jgi:hypothetical protein
MTKASWPKASGLVLLASAYACEPGAWVEGGELSIDAEVEGIATALAPVAIPKAYTAKKVYVHVMPWFQTPLWAGVKKYQWPVDPGDPARRAEIDKWGQHWTMATRNPDVWQNGRRQIASHFYPLTGPYASGDRYILEYQLLLMKYAGIDGVIIDDPGQTQLWDFPTNQDNSEAIASVAGEVGLGFAVTYEDRNLHDGNARIPGFDALAQAQRDMSWYRDHYFNRPHYIRVDGKPLITVFGPLYFHDPGSWSAVLSPLGGNYYLLGLAHLTGRTGWAGAGGFSWIGQPWDMSYFYGLGSTRMSSAFPGYQSFYGPGGWGSDETSQQMSVSVGKFHETLIAAKADDAAQIQLATWNDYGEGTMIEPTHEHGFGFLTALQSQLGVAQSQGDLELIKRLWDQRQVAGTDGSRQAQLDQAFQLLLSRQVSAAARCIDHRDCGGGSGPLPDGTYELRALHSDKCLDVAGAGAGDGVNVQQYVCNGTSAQRFTVSRSARGYELKNAASGKCVDVSGASSGDGANIHQWSCHGGDNQRVQLAGSNGVYELRLAHSGKCADVDWGSHANGANVAQWPCTGYDNQRWHFVPR